MMSRTTEMIYSLALEATQLENDELKAHIELLREVLFRYAGEFRIGKQAAQILMKTPAQSLNHIRAQVEEETIEHFCNYVAHELGLNLTRDDVANYERKYK